MAGNVHSRRYINRQRIWRVALHRFQFCLTLATIIISGNDTLKVLGFKGTHNTDIVKVLAFVITFGSDIVKVLGFKGIKKTDF